MGTALDPFFVFSDAWRRRRRRPPLHNRLIAQESDQTYGEEMKKEKGISLEENMDIEPGTEFQDQENENYYLDHEI